MSEVRSKVDGQPRQLRIAVAQTSVREDPGDTDLLISGGVEIRNLIEEAHRAGARLVQFPEGALVSPHKLIMSSIPGELAESDWSKVNWPVYHRQLDEIAALAGDLGIWVALPGIHRLSGDRRPHNSMYVINDHGRVHTRYDERYLSHTKISFMYTPGTDPVTFVVDGVKVGCAMGLECNFPELFQDYERDDVQLALFSTHGSGSPANSEPFSKSAEAHALINAYWVGFSTMAPGAPSSASALFSPGSTDPVRCTSEPVPAVATATIDLTLPNHNRPWRRKARSGIYQDHQVSDDARSLQRSSF